ncbi:Eco57I restriction-modification methylase domain-containing protein [Streptomyces wuyuanensis]|uniref:Eco57I restriction-modification methylase domain-containing protein n=1 Tax=Streptomyces wuyuanensis TaxID=1196353 RepID=UPI00382A9DBC
MLLLPALRSWLADRADVQPEMVLRAVGSAIGGRDLDPAAVWLGNTLLAAELLPVWARVPLPRREPLPALLEVGDGLTPPPAPPAISILNPPYGRVRLTDADRTQWQHVVYGHANRYGLFMAAAVEHLEEGGVAAVLVPAGWLGGSYFQRLRSYLADTAPLSRLNYVTDRSGVFSTGVLQETVLATFRKGKAPQAVTCGRVTINGRALEEEIGRGRLPASADRPWLLPRQAGDLPLVKQAQKMTRRLADYGWSVSTGPLVWNRRKPQLSAAPSDRSVKIIWAADLEGGKLHQDPSRDHLRYLHLGDKDRRVLVLNRPAVLVQRTTAPEQPRRLLAAALDRETLAKWGGEVSVENHMNVLISDTPDGQLTPRVLTALLDSEALDRLYRCLTGSVAVSAYELSALPLPGPKVLRAWASLSDEQLPAEINRVYGLQP